eukprot:gnl/Ergobibamus_cyprinoides/253.p1 GENE.gnl/Ergobibamus_cyprinoides/253~~gnl/Ergobibamus_cyprinoides/253.p1  ORF type:complete len:347 (-),score=166.46 gnl/Ergobibamus_cyprinoides/253:66-983(-)
MARSSPSDKYRLVQRLRANGEVVGVTGDGVNDAPALKAADVGLAMGLTGTEVAKEASDIVIMDDNFASIVRAIVWGRSVYDNIRKFVQFQLTVNIVALVVTFIGAVSEGSSPLNAVQLLWVNLIMDSLASLALATEEPSNDLLNRKPYGRHSSMLTKPMIRNITVQSLYQLIVLFSLLWAGLPSQNHFSWLYGAPADSRGADFDEVVWLHSMIFNSFVLCQFFNEICARRISSMDIFSGLFKSWMFTAVLGATFLFQVILVQFLGGIMETVALNLREWIVCLIIGAISLPIGIIARCPLFAMKDE